MKTLPANADTPHSSARNLPAARDVLLAAMVVAVDLTLQSDLFSSTPDPTRHTAILLVLAFAAVGFAALVWRRRFAVGVFAFLCLHAAVGSLFLTYTPVFPVCVALATVTARRSGLRAILALVAAIVTSTFWVGDQIHRNPSLGHRTAGVLAVGVLYAVIVLIAAGIGRWQYQHVRTLEEVRKEEALRAVAAERVRLARELHDIVAHAVTVMVLQAAGARRVMGTDSARADAALASVEEVGTQAMGELRRLLEVLRAGDGLHDYTDPASRPGTGDLEALVETVRGSGLHIGLRISGEPGKLDPSVDLAVYRVVQEALTNISKHVGAGAHAAVGLDWEERYLVVTVEDNGRGAERDVRLSTGHGLVGLAERVAMVGGTLKAAPLSEGGFRVAARLPIAKPASLTAHGPPGGPRGPDLGTGPTEGSRG